MEELEICVDHRGQTKCFPCSFKTVGFSYRIIVHIKDLDVIYEPDEERNLRARIEQIGRIDAGFSELVALVGEELQKQLT